MTAGPVGNTYDKYGTSNPIERRLLDGFLGRLRGMLPDATPDSIVEIGAGEGEIGTLVRKQFPTSRYVGVDLPDEELRRQWAARELQGVFADASCLPLRSGSADLLLAIEVLEHVSSPADVLREIARVARADVLLSVPNEPIWRFANLARGKYVRAFGNTPGHVQHWSPRAFTRLVAEHLDVVAVHRPLPWTMVRARVRRR